MRIEKELPEPVIMPNEGVQRWFELVRLHPDFRAVYGRNPKLLYAETFRRGNDVGHAMPSYDFLMGRPSDGGSHKEGGAIALALSDFARALEIDGAELGADYTRWFLIHYVYASGLRKLGKWLPRPQL